MSAQDSHAGDELLTIDETAMLLRIQPKSVQAAIRRGALPTTSWTGRHRTILLPHARPAYARIRLQHGAGSLHGGEWRL